MKRLTTTTTGAALLLVTLCYTGSWAAQEDTLTLTSTAEKEVTTVTTEGKKEVTRTPMKKVVPGDTVVYTNHYANTGNKPAEDAVITNPVPEHMTYVGGSAFGEGATITFSIDKGKSFDAPENLTRITPFSRKTLFIRVLTN